MLDVSLRSVPQIENADLFARREFALPSRADKTARKRTMGELPEQKTFGYCPVTHRKGAMQELDRISNQLEGS
jgi:hypothetical protein